MAAINSHNKSINSIFFPWKCKKNTCGKLASWAAFISFGWVYHPFKAVQRCFKKVPGEGKVHSVRKKILLDDPLSKKLATFNNAHVKGQINGIYITTNETNLNATRQFLRDHPGENKNTIHIGCATWHNFDIMCERKSSYGLIVDFNPENRKFIEKTIDLIALSESRDIFKQNMISYLNSLEGNQKDLYFHKDQTGLPTERIKKELVREGSWLETEVSYQYIKQLVSKGHLVAITEDITNFKSFSNIRQFLDKNNIVIDTLYLSNICNFMSSKSNKGSYVKSIKQMLSNDTIFINCPRLKQNPVTILHQTTILGKEVLSSSYDTSKLFEDII